MRVSSPASSPRRKGRRERRGKGKNVPISSITQNRNHPTSLAQLDRQLLRRHDVQGRRSTKVQPILMEQVVDHPNGLGVGNVDCSIEGFNVGGEVVGDAALSYA